MERFSMSWENNVSPKSWNSNNLMNLIRLAKKERITSHVYITEWATDKLDEYGIGELLYQISMYEILDFMKKEKITVLNDLQVF